MSKRRANTYKISHSFNQRKRIHKLMEVVDDLKDTSSHLEELIEEVVKRHGTFDDILEAVFDYEAKCLEDRRIERWRKNAKFSLEGKTFDNFDFTFPRKINLNLINELRSFRFIEENRNVLILGTNGVGKSHIACALGYEAIDEGYDTRCMKLEHIVEEANKTIDSRTGRNQKIMSLVKTKLLILDDIEDTEKLGSFNEDATDFLYTLMRKRYELSNSSTIFTFNESFKGWDKIFGSQERANKIIDRILERRYVVRIEGESYRTKDEVEVDISTVNNGKHRHTISHTDRSRNI